MSKVTKDIIVVNNFYPDPYAVRERALNQGIYPYISDIPGMRSGGVPDDESLVLKLMFEKILGTSISKWPKWTGKPGKEYQMNTCYQLVPEGERTWVHYDLTQWAGVVYLTPDPNPDSGTGLFTHIESGVSQVDPNDPSTDFNAHLDRFDPSKWRCNLEVKNQFNRLILYRGSYYHSSMVPGFGNNYVNGRLTQVFFFDE
jgi:hypothetical protein